MSGKLTVQVEAFKPLRSNTLFGFCTFVIPEVRLRAPSRVSQACSTISKRDG